MAVQHSKVKATREPCEEHDPQLEIGSVLSAFCVPGQQPNGLVKHKESCFLKSGIISQEILAKLGPILFGTQYAHDLKNPLG